MERCVRVGNSKYRQPEDVPAEDPVDQQNPPARVRPNYGSFLRLVKANSITQRRRRHRRRLREVRGFFGEMVRNADKKKRRQEIIRMKRRAAAMNHVMPPDSAWKVSEGVYFVKVHWMSREGLKSSLTVFGKEEMDEVYKDLPLIYEPDNMEEDMEEEQEYIFTDSPRDEGLDQGGEHLDLHEGGNYHV
mmetsp:Transcript_7770/g.13792  ORF Transcript_7770/g.13792 Transcript_7770/m.13792 type:complete len:189 (+) Transcript_7770:44-610(+)